eukprot:m.348389 g.348389  ORF g.348389 m.348389 type:complete len:656 (-) comp20673_c0_seq1:1432-3399(-)
MAPSTGDRLSMSVCYAERFLSDKIVDNYEGGEGAAGLYEGDGKLVFKSGHVFEGSLQHGLMHGSGKITWPDGSTYEGTFADGAMSGKGILRWADQSVYEGEVQHGLRHGQGVFKAGAVIYEGTWHRGHRHGQGSLQYSPTSIYIGSFYMNKRQGKGKMVYDSGNTYTGDWYDDERHGKGVMHWDTSQEVYNGDWVCGQQHGRGEHTWVHKRLAGSQYPRQNRYVGDFCDGQRHGDGTFYYASGAVYSGGWKQNLKHGLAVYTTENGAVYRGEFIDDHMADPSKLTGGDFYYTFTQLHKFPTGGDATELTAIQSVLMRHITHLHGVYNKYSVVGRESIGGEANSNLMTRLALHRMLKDLKVELHGLRPMDVDRMTLCIDSGWRVNAMHDEILPVQFSEVLVHVAYAIYAATIDKSETPIAKCFDLLATHVSTLLHTPVHGYVFCSDEIATMVQRKIEEFEQLYASHANGKAKTKVGTGSATHLEDAVPREHTSTMCARDVLLLCREYALFDKITQPATVVRVIKTLCPDMQRDDAVDLRVELSVLELIECLVGCALVRDPGPTAELQQAQDEDSGSNTHEGGDLDDVTEPTREGDGGDADMNNCDVGMQAPLKRTPSITLTEVADDIASMDAVGLPHDRAGQVVRVATLLGALFSG